MLRYAYYTIADGAYKININELFRGIICEQVSGSNMTCFEAPSSSKVSNRIINGAVRRIRPIPKVFERDVPLRPRERYRMATSFLHELIESLPEVPIRLQGPGSAHAMRAVANGICSDDCTLVVYSKVHRVRPQHAEQDRSYFLPGAR